MPDLSGDEVAVFVEQSGAHASGSLETVEVVVQRLDAVAVHFFCCGLRIKNDRGGGGGAPAGDYLVGREVQDESKGERRDQHRRPEPQENLDEQTHVSPPVLTLRRTRS